MYKSHAGVDSFIEILLDAVCAVDAQGRFVFVSPAGERIFGYRPEEMVGRNMVEFIAPADVERTQQAAGKIMSGQTHLHFENRYVRKDGQLVHVMWSARWSESDQLRIAVARDVTALKRAEAMQAALYAISEAAHTTADLPQLFEQIHRILHALLPASDVAVVLPDEDRGPLSAAVIRSGEALMLSPDRLTGRPDSWREAFEADWQCWLGVPLRSQKGVIGALTVSRRSGEACCSDLDLELLHYVSIQIATAIERKQIYAQLQYSAQYDLLTGLTNRVLLQDRMATAFARARRENGRLSLLFLDLDRFKEVNDALGHESGDELLQEVAARLRRCVRETDTVARVGGDEFVVLLESLHDPAIEAQITVQRIRAELQQPLFIKGHSLEIVASIGLAHYPEHSDSAAQLLKHADDAMYAEKRRRRESSVADGGGA